MQWVKKIWDRVLCIFHGHDLSGSVSHPSLGPDWSTNHCQRCGSKFVCFRDSVVKM